VVPLIFEYGKKRLGTSPTLTAHISVPGMMRRVASTSTVLPLKNPAYPEKGVKTTAGSSDLTLTNELLHTVVSANPSMSVLNVSAPIAIGKEGTGVESIKTRTFTEDITGVGVGAPVGTEVGVEGGIVPGAVAVGVGVRVGVGVAVGVPVVGGDGVSVTIGVAVAVNVGVRVGVEVGVGVRVGVLVGVDVGVGVAPKGL
jgi:hypothetical protein